MGHPSKKEKSENAARIEKRGTVFVPELDDDAAKILGPDYGQLALFTYLMQGRKVVIHPAYGWQNPNARPLVYKDLKFLQCDDVEIILGNSEATDEYIAERIEKLQQGAAATKIENAELQQYLQFSPEQMQKDCDILDEYLVAEGKVHPIGWSRDERFRKLVREELKLVEFVRYGRHLGALLLDNGSHLSGHRLQGLLDRLVACTEDTERLLSCDSIVAELMENDYPQAAITKINGRLHLLHWKAHSGEGLEVPLVNKLDSDIIEPTDPVLFRSVMEVIVGREAVEKLYALPWPEQFRLARDLRETPEWEMFLSVYYAATDELAKGSKGLDPEKVSEWVMTAYPSTAKVVAGAIPKWQTAILAGWLGAVGCGIGSMLVGGPVGIVIGGVAVVALGGVITPGRPAKKILGSIITAIREGAYCDKSELRKAIGECI